MSGNLQGSFQHLMIAVFYPYVNSQPFLLYKVLQSFARLDTIVLCYTLAHEPLYRR